MTFVKAGWRDSAMTGMGRRKVITAEEYDVVSRWRHLLCFTQRAGVTSRIKRQIRRRERHEARAEVARGGADLRRTARRAARSGGST